MMFVPVPPVAHSNSSTISIRPSSFTLSVQRECPPAIVPSVCVWQYQKLERVPLHPSN